MIYTTNKIFTSRKDKMEYVYDKYKVLFDKKKILDIGADKGLLAKIFF